MTNKPAKTVLEQIQLLKSRGLNFTENDEKIANKLIYLCNKIEPEHNIKSELLSLLENFKHLKIYKMGFFNEWQNDPIWTK